MHISIEFSDCEGFQVEMAEDPAEYELLTTRYETHDDEDGRRVKVIQVTLREPIGDEEDTSYEEGYAAGYQDGGLNRGSNVQATDNHCTSVTDGGRCNTGPGSQGTLPFFDNLGNR